MHRHKSPKDNISEVNSSEDSVVDLDFIEKQTKLLEAKRRETIKHIHGSVKMQKML